LPDLPLKNFSIKVLDVVDVVLSKLTRFNRQDADDIREMVERDLVDHGRLVARFNAAADWFSIDARVSQLPRYLKNLRTIEHDFLDVQPSDIELPEGAEG